MAYLQQRGPREWLVQASTGTGPSRRRKTALVHGTRRDALLRGAELERALHTEVEQAAAGPTLADWLATWEREHVSRLARTTQSNYRILCGHLAVSPLARLPLRELTAAHLALLERDWREHGRQRAWGGSHRPGLAPATIAGMRRYLRAALKAAVRRGLVAAGDPYAGLERLTEPIAPRRVLSLDEARALLAALDGLQGHERWQWRAVWHTALLTGLRLGELRGLERQDVDMAGTTLHIRRQVTRVRGQDVPGLPKSRKPRPVPLAAPLLPLLTEHLASHAYRLVFPAADGAPFSPTQGYRALYAVEAAAGLPERVTPHGLRHSCATLMLAAGVDLAYVSYLLGHASIATTQGYLRPVQAAQQAAAERLGQALGLHAPPGEDGRQGDTSQERRG